MEMISTYTFKTFKKKEERIRREIKNKEEMEKAKKRWRGRIKVIWDKNLKRKIGNNEQNNGDKKKKLVFQ